MPFIPEIMFFIFLVGSFLGSYYLFPKVIHLAQYKRLTADPNGRSSHQVQIPNIGGLVFFISMVFGIYFSHQWDFSNVGLSLIVGMVILLFVGLKDDLMVISPRTKSVFQIVSISLVLFNPAFHLDSLHGFLGIYEIPLSLGILFSGFVMLATINAFNFIDGIDGLAGMVGIVILGFLGYLFYLMGLYLFTSLGFVLAGSIFAFLRYNLSTNLKIFMGDTGSMLIGFLISSAVIRLFSLDSEHLAVLPIAMENLHLFVLAILIVPFFDSIRVTWIRLSKGKNFFLADRNHIHHILIDYFRFTHLKSSLIIGTFNLIFTSIFYNLSIDLNWFSVLIIFSLAFGFLVLLFLPSNFSNKRPPRKDFLDNLIEDMKGKQEVKNEKMKVN